MTENQYEEMLNLEEAVSKSEQFIVKHKNTILGVILAIVALTAGIILYKKYYAEPRENKAQVALFKSVRLLESEYYQEALSGDSTTVGFLKIINDFSGTDAANLAKAYAGTCYAKQGEYQKAIDMLDGFSASDAMVAPAFKATQGNCYIQLGQVEKGIKLLEEAAKEADNNSLSPIYLKQAGEAHISLGNYDKAFEDFSTIKSKYFNSYQAMDIDRYIEQAELLKEQK